ncbi:MAG: hypothetical protein N2038_13570 [Geminicoccaceae bacterium]|nr:hypothetical protein [Geminicoccaceae bacterium]MCX7631263.1 hypothetical protein [Geminicoccaceae bacterium]MDW8125305.1 hypothetical protein [Geminicoccaceae bacterium]MDW8342452.1 hypothetical protein [Geminicoccaceae bacterium]
MGKAALRLEDAGALLRIARDHRHIDRNSEHLSPGFITLGDLRGEQISGNSDKRRSVSVFMLCNQSLEDIVKIARDLSKEEPFREKPQGAACRSDRIRQVRYQDAPVFEIFEEPSTTGHPGHVGIRFHEQICRAAKELQRKYRDILIEMFGKVRPVVELYNSHCDSAPP